MASYKQTVLDIKDYISLEISQINYLLRKATSDEQKMILYTKRDALKDISDIIKEDGK